MTPRYRITHASALILRAIAAGHGYGFDIMDATGLPSGTVYPALRRLTRLGQLKAVWEEKESARDAGRPRRRQYHLTEPGRALLVEADARLASVRKLLDGEAIAEI